LGKKLVLELVFHIGRKNRPRHEVRRHDEPL
jgi:hypothetical protein